MYTVTTDFAGKAQFQDVVPRTYFLFGFTNTRGGFATWNLHITVSSGQYSVVLDQKNAAVAF